MNNQIKRHLSVLVAVLLLFSALPLGALAESGSTEITATVRHERTMTILPHPGGKLLIVAPLKLYEGDEVAFTPVPDEGYALKSIVWYTTDPANATDITAAKKFTMPDADVTVKVEFERTETAAGGGGGAASYPITAENTENGRLALSGKTAPAGRTVTVTVAPDEGFRLDALTVRDAKGNELPLTRVNDTTYTFTMPNSKVTVDAAFVTDDADSGVCPQDETCVYAKFPDSDPKAWYHPGVHFCVEKGYMKGISDTAFDPDGTLSRGMIVTMLWRMEGSPFVNYAMTFGDVESGLWYTEAIRWAQSTGVVLGYDEQSFGPDDDVTREQLAAILMRYADFKGIDVSERADLSRFEDAGSISGWARENIHWANAEGIVNGRTDTTLVPTGNATRAEAANMVQRFCENILK